LTMTNEEKAAKNRERVKRWKEKNPEKVYAQHKRYYLKHIEGLRQYHRNYQRMVREKARKYDQISSSGEAEK